MSRDRDDKFDASQPTLIVQYGAAIRRHRTLNRDVMVLGRAAGCDVGLEAPDVAPVHCVIVRAIDGWRVRDCAGRGGTRLNGCSVQDAALSDGDVLQVGSFSFALHLPPARRPLPDAAAVSADEALGRAHQSRRRQAGLALRLRARMAEAAAAASPLLTARQEQLDRQAEDLHALQCDVDARVAELKRTAQRIAAEKQELQEHRGRIEAAAEAHARALADWEQAHREAARFLDIRSRELSYFARFLHRRRLRLNEHEESLPARREEWLHEEATLRETERVNDE